MAERRDGSATGMALRLGTSTPPDGARRGRGATANPTGRFEAARREAFQDSDWETDVPAPLRTQVTPERTARLLARELAAPGYRPETIALGTATDPYQPVEREHRITRAVLEVLREARHPVGITTKSDLVLRDLDILVEMAARNLVLVAISLPTLEPGLARRLDPRAPRPEKRLAAMARLSAAGVPVMVNLSPIIPGLTDHEIEAILSRARENGASRVGHALLRLPGEVADLVADWFAEHYPERKARAFGLLAQARGGRENDPRFGHRFRGEGAYAAMIGQRVRLAGTRLGFAFGRMDLNRSAFRGPRGQLTLF